MTIVAYCDIALIFLCCRGVALGLATVAWLSTDGRNVPAAGQRLPSPSKEEKKDPNVSGVQAKVLARKKWKEGMKQAVAKLGEKGQVLNKLEKENDKHACEGDYRRDDVWFATLRRSCSHMTWSDHGAICLEGLGLQVVENVEEAEFILPHGTRALGLPSGEARPTSLDGLEKILELCAAKKISMIVANPDYVTVEIIYKSAMNMVGVDAKDSIAVDDCLQHDIMGANAAGIQSVFTTGGIHANELGLSSFEEVADLSSVQTLSSKYDAHPSYVLPAFI
ncbi:uncharacterized protein LOC123220813 [Mangifera indica]|uniref:uncharacterized protein LOC123220813 n=1 Tax=Mangifera indica TaxID=29780 RepID=UPI001CFA6AFF|nr:uncharacterized protein LOC123220813 [Mangifera indica]